MEHRSSVSSSFYVEELSVSEESIRRQSFSVTDIFGQTFEIQDRRGLGPPGGFDTRSPQVLGIFILVTNL
jgi:hypothetical protein